jgi:hypothetical protein
MPDRREILNQMAFGGVFTSMSSAARARPGGASEIQSSSAEETRRVAHAVDALREELARQETFWEVTEVREALQRYLRVNGKFPDYVEVGADVWQQAYDWHVRYQQPLVLGRTRDARYTVKLMETVVILRPDQPSGFIGAPYDVR